MKDLQLRLKESHSILLSNFVLFFAFFGNHARVVIDFLIEDVFLSFVCLLTSIKELRHSAFKLLTVISKIAFIVFKKTTVSQM